MITLYSNYTVILDENLPELCLSEDNDGDIIIIKGGTYPIKETLKERGMKWNPGRKRWEYATECEDDIILAETIERLTSELAVAVAWGNDSDTFKEIGVHIELPAEEEIEEPEAIKKALALKARMAGCAEATKGAGTVGPAGPVGTVCSGCNHAHFTPEQREKIRDLVKEYIGPCQIFRSHEATPRVKAKNGRGHWPHNRAVVFVVTPQKEFEYADYELRFIYHESLPSDAILSFELLPDGEISIHEH